MFKLTLERQIPLAFFIVIILLAILGFFTYRSTNSINEAVIWEKHTQEVLLGLDELLLSTVDAETSGRGYINTGSDVFLEPMQNAERKVPENLKNLQVLLRDNPPQLEKLNILGTQINEKILYMKQNVEVRRRQGLNAAISMANLGRGKQLMDDVRTTVGEMKDSEKKLLTIREDDLSASIKETNRMLLLGSIAGIISIALANFAIFMEAGKRRKAESELRDTNRNLETRVEKRTGEVTQKNEELTRQIEISNLLEQRRRIAIEAGNFGMWTVNPSEKSVELDEKSLTFFGFEDDEFDGKLDNIFKHIHDQDSESIKNLFQKSLTERVKFNAEYRVKMPDQSVRWSHCIGQPVVNENGELKNIVGFCRDITDYKNHENTLLERENFIRAILDSLSAHIVVIDKKGFIVEVNKAWRAFANNNCLIDGQVGSVGVGQNYLQVFENIAASDADTAIIFNEFKAVLNGEKDWFSYEYPCHSPAEERWFLLQVNSLQSREGGAVVSHLDITDRKKAEESLRHSEAFSRSIFENSPDCVKVLEIDGTLHSMNTNGLCIMEIDDITSFVGADWTSFWEGDDFYAAQSAVESAAKGNSAHFEGFCYTAKKTPKWWDVSVSPVFGTDGKPVRLISTSRDVTERKHAERERENILKSEQAARKEAEIANRMRDEFLATVSHELRAPLNSILGWAKLMQQGKLDETTTVMQIQPNAFVESALESVRPAADAKNIHLEIREDAGISHISGDPNRLQQVVWNLLSNAIKFTPNGGSVIAEIRRVNGDVEISVSDSGMGIKKEFLPHVFDRFRQADASSIRKFGGLGLGLAIVRHITEMHGGTVSVESEGENQGTTFVIRLPLTVSTGEESAGADSALDSEFLQKEAVLKLDGLLILVVDDETDSRQLLVQALTHYGATVTTAASAEEALTEVSLKNPDLIVSDIGMPNEDGYSLMRKIRALPDEKSRVPAVALTAFSRAQDRTRALAAGFQSHVAKPVELEELVTVIASLTNRLPINEES
jgi:PAS domain S-box-containing protein